jgi:hypothetical protein
MSPNKYKPHILVLPEDDPNRQIANGFVLNPALNERAIQVLPPVGGWNRVVDDFKNVHAHEMQRYPQRRILLIIDFDYEAKDRSQHIRNQIPEELIDRVFVLGVLSEPENLKRDLGKTFEDIGKALSQDCADNTRTVWGHGLLKHNETELDRMIFSVRPFLFN